MHILVTGGAGFIGSHLVKRLVADGHEVVVLDDLSSGKRKNVPKGVRFIKGDVRKAAKLRLPKTIDAVFHLAGQIDVRHSLQDAAHDAMVNITGTIAVLEYAMAAGAKKIVFSSSGGAIYGACDIVPTPEQSHCQTASSPYGVSKFAAEQYIDLYSRVHKLPYVILRYSNVYGPGQDGSKESGVIAIFTQLAKYKRGLTIYGNGEQTRDFVFVSDVVEANLKALAYHGNGVFNVGTGVETSINTLVQTINTLIPTPVEVHHAPARKGEEMRSCLDVTWAKKELGWSPTVSLSEGLKQTMV